MIKFYYNTFFFKYIKRELPNLVSFNININNI